MTVRTYILTESLSEFRINPDRSIDRMGVLDHEFRDFAPADSTWGPIVIGQQIRGHVDAEGHQWPFRTGAVVAVVTREDPS